MFWIILFKNLYKITKFMCKHRYNFVTFFNGEYWVLLDWCYYPDKTTPVEKRNKYTENDLYKDIWFSWDMKNSYSKGKKEDIYEV